MKKRVIYIISALMMVGIFTMSAWAVPLPASPSPVPSLGESDLQSFVPGYAASGVNIDWEVNPSVFVPFAFDYLYQLENTSAGSVDTFTVSMPSTASILGGGFLAGDDLDLLTGIHPAHVILGEEDPFPTVALPWGFSIAPTDVTWTTTAPLGAGSQSETLFFVSTLPPTYGVGGVQDHSPPSPWGSLGPASDPVPVPAVPEPTTLLLLGLSLVAIGIVGRRQMTKMTR